MTTRLTGSAVHDASILDTLAIGAKAALPTLAGGVIVRRPGVLALAQRIQADKPAIDLLVSLREKYGDGPLRLQVPGRTVVLPMGATDVHRVLRETPEPFSPATREKVAALRHFQPHGVLISTGRERARLRELNESTLQIDQPMHDLAEPIISTVQSQTRAGLADSGTVTWNEFAPVFWRIARTVVLGEQAADDTDLTDRLKSLREDANWAYLRPRRHERRRVFEDQLRQRIATAPVTSIAGQDPRPELVDQVAHWLFAFDAAGIATFRTLALLATHPDQARAARTDHPVQPYLRACLQDAVRLWPTTPMVLRESTTATEWPGRSLPAGTTFVIFAPFFHRDPELPYANRFDPDIWLNGVAEANPALVPFSDGPAKCPGQDVVRLVASTMLATMLHNHTYRLTHGPTLTPQSPLPATIDHFGLRLRVSDS